MVPGATTSGRRSTRVLLAVVLSVAAAMMVGAVRARAEQAATGADTKDPRVGLKGGLRDAGEAARHMELVASLPKPKGFFDPKAPAGLPTPPERPESEEDKPEPEKPEPPKPEDAAQRRAAGALNFSNSDLAFQQNHLFVGNFNGFNIYDIADPSKPKLVTSVVCPGGQGDLSIYGHLLFMSVEQTRGRLDCGVQGVAPPVSTERFRGVRVFDITDMKKPKQVAAVQTCRGSHTHTLVVDPKDNANVYIYGSGTSNVRSGDELSGCSSKDPKDDPETALFSIDVIQVPVATPDKARMVNRPRIFADTENGSIAGLWKGGRHGPGTQNSRVTNQCHDITVFPSRGLAAGACAGNGILLDISDPVHPVRLDQVIDTNFAYWHSATFNNDGTKVIFTDEWGGGMRPRCLATDLPNWGANAIFDIVDKKMKFASYYKLPAPQTEQENCVAHNGSIVPVPGRDIMVQGWYQGGISMFDFTDSAHPVEIAFFDRGPLDPKHLMTGGFWSAYWYNGRIYGTEMSRGIDIFALKPSEFLTQNEIDAAREVKVADFNAQAQPHLTWAASPAVARAYVDQLTRDKVVSPERAKAVMSAVAGAESHKSTAKSANAPDPGQLDALASELEGEAGSASTADAARLRALAATLKGYAASLH